MQFLANWAMMLMIISRIEVISGGWVGKVASKNLDSAELHDLLLYHASILDGAISNSVKTLSDLDFLGAWGELIKERAVNILNKNMTFIKVKDFVTNFNLRELKEYYRSVCDKTLNKYRVSET